MTLTLFEGDLLRFVGVSIAAAGCLIACGGTGNSGGSPSTGLPPPPPAPDAGTPAPTPTPAPVSRFALTLGINGQGSVRSSPAGIDCGTTCAAAFDAGTAVTLTAAPATGYRFDGWGGACTGPGGCVVTLSADAQVWATFAAFPPPVVLHTLTVAVQGSGSVVSTPAGIGATSSSAKFADGTDVMLTATPAAGATFTGWSGGCTGSTPTCSVHLTADAGATATFGSAGGYVLTTLPSMEGNLAVSPTSINNHGDVVGGYCSPCSGNQPIGHAFLYSAATGTSVRIGDDGKSSYQLADSINDAGQVAISTGGGDYYAYRWQGGHLTQIVDVANGIAYADKIDGRGFVAGAYTPPSGGERAFVWDGSAIHDLGTLGGLSGAAAINASSIAVGWSMVTGSGWPHAVVFEGGAVRDLGSLGGASASASAINDSGRIVGSADIAVPTGTRAISHPFVYDLPSGPMIDVGVEGVFTSLNSAGDAVGTCGSFLAAQYACYWHAGVLHDLNDLLGDPSWSLMSASAINDKGQIAGFAIRGGVEYGYVLTPR